VPYHSICPVHGIMNANFDGSCWCHRSTREEAYELRCLECGWHGEDPDPVLDESGLVVGWACPECGEPIEEEDGV
jgi:predicted RNA-binding Zn-ribbon protein involved in translation (DUF1610 family)